MRRVRVLAAVALPAVRATQWWPFLAALLVGYAMVALPAVVGGPSSPSLVVILLRLAALCAGLGVGFLFDDPARPTTATAPVPAWAPLAARVTAGTVAAAGWWFATLATGRAAAGEAAAALPSDDLTLEAGTVLAAAAAVATLIWRRAPRGVVGLVAAPVLLVVVFGAALLPERFKLLVDPAGAVWAAAHDRWAVALAVAVATTLVAATWEPRPPRRGAPVSAQPQRSRGGQM